MVAQRTRQVEPLCKFGPGGDFEITWQPEPPEVFEMSSRLIRLLSAAIEILIVLLGIRRAGAHVFCQYSDCSSGVIDFNREKARNADQNSKRGDPTHAPSVAVAETRGAISGKQMLLPYAGRDGLRVRHKPKHGIRTYRRAAKKRSAVRFAKQGSLFEAQFTSAKTA
jgi:hypothetical protein